MELCQNGVRPGLASGEGVNTAGAVGGSQRAGGGLAPAVKAGILYAQDGEGEVRQDV